MDVLSKTKEDDAEPATCYLNDLEVLVLITPLSKKTRRRFLDLIDQLRAEIELQAECEFGDTGIERIPQR